MTPGVLRRVRHTVAVVQISAAIIAASVALVVAFLTPTVTSLRARRQAVHDKFDAALSALLLVQASRQRPQGLKATPAGWTPQEHRALNLRTAESGFEFHIKCTADAKVALAAIAPYVPEVRDYITSKWELREDEEPELRTKVDARRAAAVKSERLFLARRPLPSQGV
ncbi:hypothetical protein GCM10009613_30550 [Pseudonocardia kongjuensis]|uniref:Uncharacterized protein n=1 Tax=Pseudonocardia kongjuensis TaxID=102227 RepID=A0ABP4IMH5_9PSEU